MFVVWLKRLAAGCSWVAVATARTERDGWLAAERARYESEPWSRYVLCSWTCLPRGAHPRKLFGRASYHRRAVLS